jgi:DNA mismatch endonuclease, patch repair protein
MGLVGSKNTKPELVIRRMIFAMGYRYRLHWKELPGRQDLVFKVKRKVIFVSGCFWHRHECKMRRMPKSNLVFRQSKLDGNKLRDLKNLDRIKAIGWASLVVWECELKNPELINRIKKFLDE